jgi:hypothetical protein
LILHLANAACNTNLVISGGEALFRRNPLRTFVAVVGLILIATRPSVGCDRQPANKNPKDVPGLSFSPRAAAANLIISADQDRNYDLVDTVDGLTFGFGNWPQQQAETLFADMAATNGGEALAALENCLSAFFSMPEHQASWKQLELKAGTPAGEPTPQAVNAALGQTLLSSTWMRRYKQHCQINCKPGEPDFYQEQNDWFPESMRFALANRQVIQWQVDYWDRTIVADGAKMAADANMRDDEAAIVGFTAYASSSPGWANDIIASAKSGGRLTFGSYVWDWNKPPHDAPVDPAGLTRWRHAIIWQFYVEHTRREQLKRRSTWNFRGRSIAYYNTYLKAFWVLPARDTKDNPIWNSEKNLDPALLKPRI